MVLLYYSSEIIQDVFSSKRISWNWPKRTEQQLAYKCKKRFSPQSMNPGEEVCYVVYISKWFSENSAMFFCNFGRSTHEGNSTFWTFPSFPKNACFCPNLQEYISLFSIQFLYPDSMPDWACRTHKEQETRWRQIKRDLSEALTWQLMAGCASPRWSG